MGADGGGTGDDRDALRRLRRRLYQPDAGEADREAYEALLVRVGPEPARPPVAVERDAEDVVATAPPRRRTLRDVPLRWRVVGAVGALALVGVAVIALVQPSQPSLGPLTARRTTLTTLTTTATAGLPERFGSEAVASFFERVPSTRSERTTAARKPFFGAGVGPTDFDLQQYDVGATTVSVTVVTDASAPVSAVLATRAGAAGTHRVFLAAGEASALRPIDGAGAINGLETPSVLRVDVPSGTRFVVRAVFLTPIDPGTIDAREDDGSR